MERTTGWDGALKAIMNAYGRTPRGVHPAERADELGLPRAMVAPAPVSALLHAVAVVKAGVFSITKIVIYIFGLDFLAHVPAEKFLVYLVGFTIVAASTVTLRLCGSIPNTTASLIWVSPFPLLRRFVGVGRAPLLRAEHTLLEPHPPQAVPGQRRP